MWFRKIKKPIIALAPMFGYSNKSFRLKCRRAGADAVFTEMVAAEAIIRNIEKAWQMCEFDERERPVIIQIFSNNPSAAAQASRAISSELHPDGIDINFGCPVQKAAKQGFGSILLNNLDLSSSIIKAVVSETDLPVSVKMRLPTKKISDTVSFVEMAREAGVSLISIHGRTQTQKYGKHSDWELIHKVKEKFKHLPILGNGDIESLQDLKDKIGNLDGALIGRAAKRDYHIFEKLSLIKSEITQPK